MPTNLSLLLQRRYVPLVWQPALFWQSVVQHGVAVWMDSIRLT